MVTDTIQLPEKGKENPFLQIIYMYMYTHTLTYVYLNKKQLMLLRLAKAETDLLYATFFYSHPADFQM